MTAIARHYVEVDGRLVHLRTAGNGPCLLLLHQSPRSSAELVPLIALLAPHFTVIAPDTPGNGLSDPLTMRDPEIEPFADAVARLLDRLDIARCGVYGYHTGAAIGFGFALRHSERVAYAVFNGLPGFDSDEQATILANYLPAFEPRWDGSHLAWAWARLREQTVHFPWYDARTQARMDFDVPPPEALQQALLDLLRAGDRYRDAYGAAFRLNAPLSAPYLRVPARIVATARDPLRPHLDRYTDLADHLSVMEVAPGNETLLAHLLDMAGQHSASDGLAPPIPAVRRQFYGEAGKQIHMRQFGAAPGGSNGKPLVLLDGRYGSGRTIARIADAAAIQRPVFAPCLPGCGDSDDDDESEIEQLRSHLPDDAEIIWLNSRTDAQPAPEPRACGGHLLETWQRNRDFHLFTDTHPARANIRWGNSPGEVAQLQDEVLGFLMQRNSFDAGPVWENDLSLERWRRRRE